MNREDREEFKSREEAKRLVDVFGSKKLAIGVVEERLYMLKCQGRGNYVQSLYNKDCTIDNEAIIQAIQNL